MTTPCLRTPVAVRMNDCIVVFSSRKVNREYIIHENWSYNLWTEQWRKCPVPQGVALPDTRYMSGVAIGPVIYMFGVGFVLCSFWKLTQSTDGSFDWNQIRMQNQKRPSPRKYHCAWAYEDKMWIFGGHGKHPFGYLNHDEDFEGEGSWQWINNQLFSYDPSVEEWTSIKCSGKIPSPRYSASAAKINDKVWLYGGKTSTGWQCELYELNLISLTWTHVRTGMPTPQIYGLPFLTLLRDNLLALLDHGDSQKTQTTWLLDVESYKWRLYHEAVGCYCLPSYSSRPGVSNDATILVGGYYRQICDTGM